MKLHGAFQVVYEAVRTRVHRVKIAPKLVLSVAAGLPELDAGEALPGAFAGGVSRDRGVAMREELAGSASSSSDSLTCPIVSNLGTCTIFPSKQSVVITCLGKHAEPRC